MIYAYFVIYFCRLATGLNDENYMCGLAVAIAVTIISIQFD